MRGRKPNGARARRTEMGVAPATPSTPELTAIMALRAAHPFKPWDLAFVKVGGAIVEITSFPYEGGGHVWVMARSVIGDPTTNRVYGTNELATWATSLLTGDMKSYRDGFIHGYACAVAAVQKLRKGAI